MALNPIRRRPRLAAPAPVRPDVAPTTPARPDAPPVRREHPSPFRRRELNPRTIPRPKAAHEAIETGEYGDFIDRSHKRRLAKHTSPGIPDRGTEAMASSTYQDAMRKLAKYTGVNPKTQGDVMRVTTMMMSALEQVVQIEKGHEAELEQAAVELVLELPEFASAKAAVAAGEIKVRAQLTSDIDLDAARDEADDVSGREELKVAQIAQELDLEVQKRRLINMMIHGNAMNKLDAYHLASAKLNKISPKLLNLYGVLTSVGEFGYWVFPEEMQRQQMAGRSGAGGAAHIRQGDDGVPEILGQGATFPMLVHELVKAMMEYVSYDEDAEPDTHAHVTGQADTLDHELLDIKVGPAAWKRVVALIDDQAMIPYVYDYVVHRPAAQFHTLMHTLLSGGAAAKQAVDDIVKKVKSEHAQSESRTVVEAYIPEESRLEALQRRYGGKVDPAIIAQLAAFDPTNKKTGDVGGYADWIVRQYLKLDNLKQALSRAPGEPPVPPAQAEKLQKELAHKQKMFIEDIDRVKDDLDTFEKHKHKLPDGKRDINQLKTLDELYQLVKPLKDKPATKREAQVAGAQAIFHDDQVTVYKLLTFEGSRGLGNGTRWCTVPNASTFNSYMKQGPLIVFKFADGSRYQLCDAKDEKPQLMDEEDRPVSAVDFLKKDPNPAFKAFLISLTSLGPMKIADGQNTRHFMYGVIHRDGGPAVINNKTPGKGLYYQFGNRVPKSYQSIQAMAESAGKPELAGEVFNWLFFRSIPSFRDLSAALDTDSPDRQAVFDNILQAIANPGDFKAVDAAVDSYTKANSSIPAGTSASDSNLIVGTAGAPLYGKLLRQPPAEFARLCKALSTAKTAKAALKQLS